ncbi:MAG: DUF362 domain-containing protein [Candidatus Kariarchaeaceae archaeon]|jgi:uncharacterized protein (DUF362 family)
MKQNPTVTIVDPSSLYVSIDQICRKVYQTSFSRNVVIKVGIYNTERRMCTTSETLDTIIRCFDQSKVIRVVESDSFAGQGMKRLEIWNDCYDLRTVPFNLSDDENTEEAEIAGESVALSHILFETNTLISTHVPRRYEDCGDDDLLNMGSIIKNLLGIIPDKKKYRFHKQLPTALLDIYEAIGGIDLAILDGTSTYLGRKKQEITVPSGFLAVGKDAFAVEAVGAYMVGFNPLEMPVLQEAKKRGLGEIDVSNIKIIGDIETPRKMILEEFYQLTPQIMPLSED